MCRIEIRSQFRTDVVFFWYPDSDRCRFRTDVAVGQESCYRRRGPAPLINSIFVHKPSYLLLGENSSVYQKGINGNKFNKFKVYGTAWREKSTMSKKGALDKNGV